MATPEAEEAVKPVGGTVEAVVAGVQKSIDAGKEEVVSSEDPAATTESVVAAEETEKGVETPGDDVDKEVPEAVEPSIPAFKEESNVVSELKESEKKALDEFKVRVDKAIKGNEFVLPPPPPPKAEPETTAPTSESKAVETPAPTSETTATPESTLASETPVVESEVSTSLEAAVGEETETASTKTQAETPSAEASVEVATPTTESEFKEATVEPAVDAVTAEAVEPVAESPGNVTSKGGEKNDVSLSELLSAPDSKVDDGSVEPKNIVDATPPEDVYLWGVPLDPSQADERTDVILLKFLRARDFKVNEAFTQLKNTVIWRKSFKADSLLEEEFGHDLDAVAFNHGFDKLGHPVCYNVYGSFQDKELYQKTFGDASKITDFLRWRIQVLEKGIKLLSFSPKGPSALVQITDLKNSPGPAKKELKSATNQAVNLFQDNYPELVAKKVFINVPWYFSALYSLFSPFLTQRTKSKFVVAPSGKTTEALLKFISAENVPVSYGGLSRTNDPDFTGVESSTSETILKAGDKTTIEIPVESPDMTATWDLAVVGYDVNFEAEYVPSSGGYATVIEKKKKLPSTTEEPLRGSFKATEAGKVVINVDNSSSRKRKIVLFRYVVKPTVAIADKSVEAPAPAAQETPIDTTTTTEVPAESAELPAESVEAPAPETASSTETTVVG